MDKTQNGNKSRHKVKLLPLIMAVVSLLYLIYVVSLGNTKMIGDEIGGDPGGMILPLTMAVFMLCGFTYLAIKERPTETEKKTREENKVTLCTFLVAIAYVVCSSYLGFVLTSSLTLFALMVLYMSIGQDKLKWWVKLIGLVSFLVATVAVYSIFRVMTRAFLRMGRSGQLPAIFGNSNFTAFLSLLVLLAFTLVFVFTIGRISKGKSWRRLYTAGIISMVSTLFLYIVFRQFFLVTLLPGIITW